MLHGHGGVLAAVVCDPWWSWQAWDQRASILTTDRDGVVDEAVCELRIEKADIWGLWQQRGEMKRESSVHDRGDQRGYTRHP